MRISLLIITIALLPIGRSQEVRPVPIDATVIQVQEIVNDCNEGDIVDFPSGYDQTWDQMLIANRPITIRGAGKANTIIRDGVPVSAGNRGLISMGTELGKSYRITGIGFYNASGDATQRKGKIRIGGFSRTVRIDNCHFEALADENILFSGGAYGVIDNCTFVLRGQNRALMFKNGNEYGADDRGDGVWEHDAGWGSNKAVYLEDCQIEQADNADNFFGAIDGWIGGKVVVRFCTLYNNRLSNHGTESGQRDRGGRMTELYNNVFVNPYAIQPLVEIRSGCAFIFNNTINTAKALRPGFIKLENYRNHAVYKPWGSVDGTKAWDTNDLSDDESTPGGPGDGVFEGGTTNSSSPNKIFDTGKAWTPNNKWDGYILRVISSTYTATSGGVRTATVTGVGWTNNQWSNWEFTRILHNGNPDNSKSLVTGSTSAGSITLHPDFASISISAGDQFYFSRASEIDASDLNSVTVKSNALGGNYSFPHPISYEIRKAVFALDQPGAGTTGPLEGDPPQHQGVNQQRDGVYQWRNAIKIGNGPESIVTSMSSPYSTIRLNRDYFNYSPSFETNGGVGVGVGETLPEQCTTGSAFWVLNEGTWGVRNGVPLTGTLYIATGPNTWGRTYQPYTYPHPLREEETPEPEPPPTGIVTRPQGGTIGVHRR